MMAVLQRLHDQQQGEGGVAADHSSTDGSSNNSDSDSDEQGPDNNMAYGPPPGPALKQLLKRALREGASFDVQPSDLTPELMRELEALSVRGHLSHLVQPWEPWWESDAAAALQLNTAGQRVIQDMQQLHQQVQHQQTAAQDVSGAVGGSTEVAKGLPQPSEEALPTLQQLAGQAHRPSVMLPWQLLQLLVAYCAVMRQYNGDPQAEGGWEAAQQLLLQAPPLIQAALAGSKGSKSSSNGGGLRPTPTAAPQPDLQEQAERQAQSLQAPRASILPPDSVRCACLQLLDAAVAAGSSPGGQEQWQEQLTAAAAAVSSGGGGALEYEQRTLLQVAQADAFKLLDLGRPAVVLALTDSRRLMQAGKEQVKQQLQASGGKGQQLQRQRRQLQQLRQCFGLAGQKLWYFMVWSNEQAAGVCPLLAQELAAELQGQQAAAQQDKGIALTKHQAEVVVPQKPAGPVLSQEAVVDCCPPSCRPVAEPFQPVTGLYDLD